MIEQQSIFEKYKNFIIVGIIVIVLLMFVIPWDNNATVGDLSSYTDTKDYTIVNASIHKHNADNVIVKVYAKPQDFYLTLDLKTNDELLVGKGALIAQYKNDSLDGKYTHATPIALSKKGHVIDQVLKFLHIKSSNVYEAVITQRTNTA